MLNIELIILNHVKKYVTLHLPEYEALEVRRKSVCEADNYLYMMSAKKSDGTYAVWTCWNESTQCLNHGHYNLHSLEECEKVFTEFYNGRD